MVLKVFAWPQTWRSLSLPPRGCRSSAGTEATATLASRRPANPTSIRNNVQIFFLLLTNIFAVAGCTCPLSLPRSGGTLGPSDHLSSTLANRDLGRPRKSGSSLTWWTHENRNYLEKSTMIYLLLSLSVLDHVIVDFLVAKAA